ncbi:hypothetical protein [Paraburkholderia sediminicola]|uniref:hypothetical protein n=1 Tax=Paraburkholderia sediminicola TaxID=458836 RepID=UPI0038BC0132
MSTTPARASGALGGGPDAVSQIDNAIASLKRAADLIVDDYSTRKSSFSAEQEEGFAKVLGHIIEHIDSLHVVRHGILTVGLTQDADVDRLIRSAGEICKRILGTTV